MFESFKSLFRGKPEIIEQPARDSQVTKTAARLATVPRMEERFPHVKHLACNLIVTAPDRETEPTMNGRSFGPKALAFFEFRCKNVECYQGGFDIADSVATAIGESKTEASGRRVCRGWAGKHRVHQLRCHYELNFKLNISYHERSRQPVHTG